MRIAVIGLGKFGRSIIEELSRLDHEVLGIDLREELVEKIKDIATFAVIADASSDQVIRELSLETMDLIVVAIGKGFENSMMVTTRLKQLKGPKLFVRSISDLHGQLLEMTGVHGVLSVEKLAADQLAHQFDHQEFVRHIVIGHEHAVAEVIVPEEFIGRTLQDTELRSRHRLNLITVLTPHGQGGEESREALKSIPTPDLVFARRQILVLYGHERDLGEFMATYGPRENSR